MKNKQNASLLFNTIIEEAKLKNDAQLARLLGILPTQLCNIRAGRVNIGPAIILRILEAHPISLLRIKTLLSEPVEPSK